MWSRAQHWLATAAATVDRAAWLRVPAARSARFRCFEQTAYPFQHVPIDVDDARIKASFARYNAAPQHSYIYHYRQRSLIEPTFGYVVTRHNQIVPESVPYAEQIGQPPLTQHVAARLTAHPTIRTGRVILLRDHGERNYYHWYTDVLAKLELLERHGLRINVPLVISRALAAMPYFQHTWTHSRLRDHTWIVQDDTLIDADEIIFCKTLPHQRRAFDWACDLLHAPAADLASNERIFLTRSPQRGRAIENIDQIERVCAAAGFSAVDADHLTLDQQIELFRRARYIIGIHGAGLVNLIFRRNAPATLLELFPPDNIPPHYFWLCHQYGFGYHALVGSAGTTADAFLINPTQLRQQIEAMI